MLRLPIEDKSASTAGPSALLTPTEREELQEAQADLRLKEDEAQRARKRHGDRSPQARCAADEAICARHRLRNLRAALRHLAEERLLPPELRHDA